MASERTIGRYPRWYARLLRLYPRPFRQRFGEPMAQTFTDLCRERTDANRGLHAFALRTFAEDAFFIAAWIESGVLFRRAALEAAPA